MAFKKNNPGCGNSPGCECNGGVTIECCCTINDFTGFTFTFSGIFGHASDECDDCEMLNDTWTIPANFCCDPEACGNCEWYSGSFDHCPNVTAEGESWRWNLIFREDGGQCSIELWLAPFATGVVCGTPERLVFQGLFTLGGDCTPPWTLTCTTSDFPECFRAADGFSLDTAPATTVTLDIY